MNAEGQLMKETRVRFERVLPGPIERVWDFLTDTRRLPDWYGHGMIEPRVGGAVRLMGGHIRGVVTQWTPPRRLSYTWNVFNRATTNRRILNLTSPSSLNRAGMRCG